MSEGTKPLLNLPVGIPPSKKSKRKQREYFANMHV
jgi:hypothetical protein